jgi:hypothetical protein
LFHCGFQFGTLFAKIAQLYAKYWLIYGFVSKFSIISAASPKIDLTALSGTLFKNYFVRGIRKSTHFIAFLNTPWSFE